MLARVRRAIEVDLEVSKGTEVAGTLQGWAFDPEINDTSESIDRPGVGTYMGHNLPAVIGRDSGKAAFGMEMKGDGAAALDPTLAALFQACGLTQTAEVYQVDSEIANHQTMSIDDYLDGDLRTLYGAMGNLVINVEHKNPMMCNFDFMGRWKARVAGALPAVTPSKQLPFRLSGGSFLFDSAARKLYTFELNMNNNVVLVPDNILPGGIESAEIVQALPTITMTVEDLLVATYDFGGKFKAGTEIPLVLVATNGTDQITISVPRFQINEAPTEGDNEGIATLTFTGQCNNVIGDDSVVMTAAVAS